MLLESFGSRGRKNLESEFEKLNNQLKNTQADLENKERQIQHLSKNLRKWTRKYHELELSISESVIEETDSTSNAQNEETKQLQTMLLKLNHKNQKLEKHLKKLQSLSDGLEAEQSAAAANSKATISKSQSKKDELPEPEFSAKLQSKFEEYASKYS